MNADWENGVLDGVLGRIPFASYLRSSAWICGFRIGPSNPDRAQLWFEWRSSGYVLPLVLAALCMLMSVPLLWVRDMVSLVPSPPGSEFGSIEVNLWLKLMQPCLFAPPLFAAILGCGRSFGIRGKDLSLHPFLAIRPLRANAFVRAKLGAAALSTLTGWAVMLLFATGWLLLPAREGATTAPLLSILCRHCPPESAVALLLTLALLMLWTWKNQVQGLFADLSGRAWLVYGMPVLAHGFALIAFVECVSWSAGQVGRDVGSMDLPAAVPWGIGLALTLKLVGAGCALYEARRRRLASPGRLASLAAVWGIVALCLFGALAWIASHGANSGPLARSVTEIYFPLFGAGAPAPLRSLGYLAVITVLFVPFTRLVMAPLMFEWNRHG
jgi:hypothetical protein